ncbi:MAG: alpha-glucosidase, partial [Lachnospiraceae bacterium]|nr:alpha-glucosidase [Lachnospiraceae bacterium]
RKHLEEVFDAVGDFAKGNLDINRFFQFKDLMSGISNNEEDYASFYHNYKGQKIRHDKVHNLFGYYMTRSASEAFKRLVPDREVLMFSRSSYIGMHRYAGIWQGDNKSWWSHLLMNLKMMPSLNMCGFLYTGADLGGFGDQTTEDLMIRWLSLGIFTPLMRNHSALGTRFQEVYRFDAVDQMKGIIQLRYRLIPYLYQAYEKAINEDTMMFYPLGMVYPEDTTARRIEDQLLVGDDIMIAPIYEQNAVSRHVYLPEDMRMLRFRGAELVEERPLSQGHHYIDMPLGEVCIFVRNGHQLQLADIVESVADLDWDNLTFV